MASTRYTVGSGGMIMRDGCDTGYFARDGKIYKGGSSTEFSIDNGGKILKGSSFTGYRVGGGGKIAKDEDKGFSIDWMFN